MYDGGYISLYVCVSVGSPKKICQQGCAVFFLEGGGMEGERSEAIYEMTLFERKA